MIVLGINKVLKWCNVAIKGRKDICPTKVIEGELYFKLKKQWYKVEEYICEDAEEIVEECGKIITRPYRK